MIDFIGERSLGNCTSKAKTNTCCNKRHYSRSLSVKGYLPRLQTAGEEGEEYIVMKNVVAELATEIAEADAAWARERQAEAIQHHRSHLGAISLPPPSQLVGSSTKVTTLPGLSTGSIALKG